MLTRNVQDEARGKNARTRNPNERLSKGRGNGIRLQGSRAFWNQLPRSLLDIHVGCKRVECGSVALEELARALDELRFNSLQIVGKPH